MPMPHELVILRHAKSAWSTAAPTDFERPLSTRGLRDAPRVGRWLADQGLLPELVFSSPARRAAQTVTMVLEAMDLDTDIVRWEECIYGASLDTLLALLEQCPPGCRRLLLVGHNPGLGELVLHLSGEAALPVDEKRLPTAAVAHFRRGELVEIVRPRSLAGH